MVWRGIAWMLLGEPDDLEIDPIRIGGNPVGGFHVSLRSRASGWSVEAPLSGEDAQRLVRSLGSRLQEPDQQALVEAFLFDRYAKLSFDVDAVIARLTAARTYWLEDKVCYLHDGQPADDCHACVDGVAPAPACRCGHALAIHAGPSLEDGGGRCFFKSMSVQPGVGDVYEWVPCSCVQYGSDAPRG